MIRKAVIPAAGLGTRFLPITKSQPKEMLPIVDTPTIQFVVEEAVASGIKDILIITGKGKRSMEDHFDRSFELEYLLKSQGKTEALAQIQKLSNLADIHFIRQKEQFGLGHAIHCAKAHIGNEPFAVLLGDTLVSNTDFPCTKQLINIYNKYQSTVIGLEEVPEEKVMRYGIINGRLIEDSVYLIKDLIEKPSIEEAPSNLAVGGRYIFTPDIFDFIEKTKPGKNNEIQITDAMRLMKEKTRIYGFKFDAKRYDIGNRLDYLKTIVEFALKREDIGKEFKEYLFKILNGGKN